MELLITSLQKLIMQLTAREKLIMQLTTREKCPKTGFFLVRIFLY